MPILIRCTCGKALKIKEDFAGKKVRCPGCGQVLSVPLPGEGRAGTSALPADITPSHRDRPVPSSVPAKDGEKRSAGISPVKPPQEQPRSKQVLGAVLGLLIVSGIALAWWFFFLGGGNTGLEDSSWAEFVATEGAFKVMLPGKPSASTRTLNTAEGPIQQHLFKIERPEYREAFIATYVDYPVKMAEAGADTVIDGELALLHDAPGPAIRKERRRSETIGPGLHAGYVAVISGDKTVRVKAIMFKQRLFTLMVQSPYDQGSEPIAKKIFDSFQIVGVVPDHFAPRGSTEAFSGHIADIDAVALSFQKDKLATVARDGTLRVWEYPSGREIAFANLRDDFRNPNSVAFAPDGNTLAVGLGGPGEKLLLWDLPSRGVKVRVDVGGSAETLAFSADGEHLIFETRQGIYRFDPKTPTKGQDIGPGIQAVLSPDGKRLLAFAGKELKVYEMGASGPRPGPPLETRFKDDIGGLALSGDGRLLGVASGGRVHLWDALKLAPLGKDVKTIDVQQLALSARGDVLAVRGFDDFALYALPDGKELVKENVPLQRLKFLPDSKLLLVQGSRLTFREGPWSKKEAGEKR